MFGSSKPGGQPPERTKAADPVAEQFDDVPPMPEAFKPVPATSTPAVSPPRKTFNFADKPKPQSSDEAAHLYIGANIRLKGEIASCEVMRVDGVYEGIAKTRQLIVCPGGSFFGTAEIEEAEIHGCFEGSLHVRGRLFLRKQGKIRGTFSYGQLEIERGGEIDGRILPFDKKGTAALIKTVEAAPGAKLEAAKPAAAARSAPATAPVRPAGAVNGAGAAPLR
jgi:cytoskeletal protein CcmA (bactofilin family)